MPEITEETAQRLGRILRGGSVRAGQALGLRESFSQRDLEVALSDFLCDVLALATAKRFSVDLAALAERAALIHSQEQQFIPQAPHLSWRKDE